MLFVACFTPCLQRVILIVMQNNDIQNQLLALHYIKLEVRGSQLLVCGPSSRLDFVLRALWALRPCDPRNDVDTDQENILDLRY